MASAFLSNNTAQTLSTTSPRVAFTQQVLENGTLANNAVTVNVAGLYRIDYGLTASADEAAIFGLYRNEAVEPSSEIAIDPTGRRYSTAVLLNLAAGDTLYVALLSGSTVTVPADGTSAYLVITPVHT